MSVIEKAVDCLRILTTGNEANKVALLTSASGLPCLVRLMETSPDQVHCSLNAADHAQASIIGLDYTGAKLTRLSHLTKSAKQAL